MLFKNNHYYIVDLIWRSIVLIFKCWLVSSEKHIFSYFQTYYDFSETQNTFLFWNKWYCFVSEGISLDRITGTSDSKENFIKSLKLQCSLKIYIFYCSQFLQILTIQPPAVILPLKKGITSPSHAVPQDIQSPGFYGDVRMETIYLYRRLMKCKKVFFLFVFRWFDRFLRLFVGLEFYFGELNWANNNEPYSIKKELQILRWNVFLFFFLLTIKLLRF